MAGIDAIYRFTTTASVLAKGFAIGGAVGSVPVASYCIQYYTDRKLGKQPLKPKRMSSTELGRYGWLIR
jgi:hypothetical protein